jgi:hypothetical protein
MKSLTRTMLCLSMLSAVASITFLCAAHGQGLKLAVTQNGTILSGGPGTQEASQALEARIEQQAHGQAKLVEFTVTGTRESDVEVDGRTFCQVDFAAAIEFAQPCRWAIRYGGKPLTFDCLKPGEHNPQVSEMPGQTIEVSTNGERFTVHGAVWFSPGEKGWRATGFSVAGTPEKSTNAQAKQCELNLRRICLAFRMWAMDNGDHYPFNVSTNAGGTLELCRTGHGGIDQNAAQHWRLLADALGSPQILVCPGDASRKAAMDFKSLQTTNISYQLRTGPTIDESNPQEILVRCPIHGSILRTDGSIQ